MLHRYEGSGEGLHWYNLFRAQSVDNDLSVGLVMAMMLVAALIYLLVALYVEQIRPGDYGVPQPWYFPVSRTFWLGSKPQDTAEIAARSSASPPPTPDSLSVDGNIDDYDNPANFEGIDATAFNDRKLAPRAGIQIRALRKRFNASMVAVHGLTLDMYEDQITVLLGHNGAGKTTTMHMLTGMLPPSGGTALVNGCV